MAYKLQPIRVQECLCILDNITLNELSVIITPNVGHSVFYSMA